MIEGISIHWYERPWFKTEHLYTTAINILPQNVWLEINKEDNTHEEKEKEKMCCVVKSEPLV